MKLNAFDHPKTLGLKSALKCSLPTVIGHLELLWKFVAQHASQGDIGKWPDAAISGACCWEGDPCEFVYALIEHGYLEHSERHRLLVHDWHEHCPQWVRAALAKKKLPFATKESPQEGSKEPTEEATKEPTRPPSIQAKPSQAKEEDKDMGQQTGPSSDAKPASPPATLEGFQRIRELYPKRDGSQRWADAEKHYRARLREGTTAAEIEDGIVRYAKYCHARGLTGTDKVQQAATFLGTNRGFLEAWDVVRKPVLVPQPSMGGTLR
ncbi:MAG TPA: hypothetical protein VFW88_06840 [Burkholderiales bacterium]|nr:hypothetical protein [Burkholderiales bacterium]